MYKEISQKNIVAKRQYFNKDKAKYQIAWLWNQCILTDLKMRDLCNSHQKTTEISLWDQKLLGEINQQAAGQV